MSIPSINSAAQTNLEPNVLLAYSSNSDTAISVNQNGIVLGGNLNTSPIYATISQSGLSTTNATGFDILSKLNMNQNNIDNVSTISNNNADLNVSSGADSVNITAGVSVVLNATSEVNINATDNGVNISSTNNDVNLEANNGGIGVFGFIYNQYMTGNINTTADQDINLTATNGYINLNASQNNITLTTTSSIVNTAPLTSIVDGVNNDYIHLDMRTNIDQIPTIEIMKDNLVASIYKNNDLYITTDQGLQQTADKQFVIKSNNDSINLWSPTNKIFIDKTFVGAGDGEIVCSAITGSLNGNASTATTATNATTATQASYIQVNNTSANLTHYLGFFDSNTSGYKIPQATNGLTFNPNSNTLTTTSFVGSLTGSCSTTGLVYISSGTLAITGSASATNIAMPSIFNSTYKNYRVVLAPTTQLSFLAYPTYSLTAFSGTGTLPTTASLYGNELTSASSSSIVAVYTAGATIATTPLVFAVSQAINHQTIFEIENVGFTATQLGQVGLKCKSFYSNPGVSGYSDRHILSTNSAGTITGLTIQQSSISVGNNMTIGWTIYGYK